MAVVDRESKRHSVIDALNNPKYEWRTLSGISKETGIPIEDIIDIIGDLRTEGLAIESDAPTKDGTYLFITRDKLYKRSNLGEKILSAIRNRII